MRKQALWAVVLLMLVVNALIAHAPPQSSATPSFEEVDAAWKGFWGAAILGALAGARKYIHCHRQHMFPGDLTVEELQDVARQMAYCRLDPTPFPFGEDVIYRVLCHGRETAETQVGLRRDLDGVWRFSVL